MAIRSRTRNGWGNVSGVIGNSLAFPANPASFRIVIPGNDIKRVFSVSAGYIPASADIGAGIMLSGLLVICQGVLNEENVLDPARPFDLTEMGADSLGLTGFAQNRILFACPVSGVTPFHATFSDQRTIESNESDAITILLTFCYRSDTVGSNVVLANGFLNAFGTIDIAGQKKDFSDAYEIR